jgi:hypothetical protein
MDPSEQGVLSRRDYHFVTPTDISMTIVKADYEQRFLKGKLGTGYKLSHVVTDNTFEFYNVIDNEDVLNTDRSNQFTYDEMVNAAYLNYNGKVDKWGFQAGLRAEHTHWEGDLTSAVSENDKKERTL